MQIIATHINYYHVCRRKLWLFANGINMEQTSDIVADGNETSQSWHHRLVKLLIVP
jgi:CRISPR/Cas system-associated exonuclease Cas4 (RecB family)